ncbi:phosphoenolpyruvate--protein phosphotransferase [Halodesulfovibrio sp.]|jgi:phosphocarrier protein FPr|uniref:phosphoenolpyruvate--protein phosphotransferase n=1 Tax=Halodesulfovibrio sp. TaxID=1912772 RepID=UPI0025D1AAFF|nr:phosphoenolpyruvate--protein phosphotransferase [Halodesulfovibrio sp.]MCT4535931.1 phosphoenolpyruvate--protein phosphotransferase [Halodesulfovibrio sp.]
MVGIVLVSHCRRLAEGLHGIIEQITQGAVPVALAAGSNDEEHPIGTDPAKVLSAIQQVQQGDGVLVLMDLGSAILSAETAIDLLPEDQQRKVYMSSAPLVEGAMAAAIQIAAGADMEAVLKDAETIVRAKAKQLGVEEPNGHARSPHVEEETPPAREKSEEISIVVPNRLGLHARPAARIVGTLGGYVADVWLIRKTESASARSLNQITMLAVQQGETIQFRAVGVDAKDALSALTALAEENFGDVDKPDYSLRNASMSAGGIAAAPGTALGPIVWYRPMLPTVEKTVASDSEVEMIRLAEAIAMARIELADLEYKASGSADSAEEAEFFALHSMLLDDPYITCSAHDFMTKSKYTAEAAWSETIDKTMERYRTLQNEYVRGRAADVLDVGIRVLRALTGEKFVGPEIAEPSILVATDLGPSDMVELDMENVLGIVTQEGGATSHVAVFARALKIPAVAGVHQLLEPLQDGDIIGLNGATGEVWISPDAAKTNELKMLRSQWDEHVQDVRLKTVAPAVTRDGKTVRVEVNAKSVEEIPGALESGADSIAILRTEDLYLNRVIPPSEEEQVEVYTKAAELLKGEPLVIATADLGGDNQLPYLEQHAAERHSCFDKRGIRFSLAHKELFLHQIKAILRVAADHPLKMLLPMVSQVTELRDVHSIINEVRAMLKKENIACAANIEVGVVIEVPSAVFLADQLAREADFFVLGGDDLARYVMVYDPKNSVLGTEYDEVHPAILRIIRDIIAVAHEAGIPVSVGGEVTSNLQAVFVLVGLGVDSLAVAPNSIEQTKDLIRTIVTSDAKEIAVEAMELPDASSVKTLISLHCCMLT